MRNKFHDIEIEVVIKSLCALKNEQERTDRFTDVKTVMFDIEDVHYKRKITVSNRKMIDESDYLICYVDERVCKSGAKDVMRYALKKGIKVVNIYREEDELFYGMTKEEIYKCWENL